MFTASTVYHLQVDIQSKGRWQIVDHTSIYFLIAGTYTPFLVFNIASSKGSLILGLLWGLTIIGSILKIFHAGKYKLVSTIIYLLMGWAAVFTLKDFLENIPQIQLIWIGIGGIFYTLGTLFYLWKKLTYHHAIWHLFVLGGSVSHWYAVWLGL